MRKAIRLHHKRKTSDNPDMTRSRFSSLLLSAAACSVLAACVTTAQKEMPEDQDAQISAALERAVASTRSKSNKSLALLENAYKRNSEDEAAALEYAAALRRENYTNRAAIVLAPFANDESSTSATKAEYAAIQLAQGSNAAAEEYAQNAILQDETNYQAYHYLGIALDAQGSHKEAERAFRKGLEHWEGNPTAIMNNLALNLASQGFLDEASEILQKALAVAPDRLEVERNLRIITALQQSHGYTAPKPDRKPDLHTVE